MKPALVVAAIGVATALVISGYHAGRHAEVDAAAEREIIRLRAELERVKAQRDGEYWSATAPTSASRRPPLRPARGVAVCRLHRL